MKDVANGRRRIVRHPHRRREKKEPEPKKMEQLLAPERAERLAETVADPDGAAELLSERDREAYEEAQQSIVDARRSAELHEGLLQID
jgi:hypothetical protein